MINKDVTIRTLKTFVQAFISAISIDVFFDVSDFEGFKKVLLATLVASFSAGICAVWNSILEMIKEGEI